ncbi:hypothetical protein Tco_0436294 [Tanacetum coccineum]
MVVEKLVVVVGDFGIAHFVDVGNGKEYCVPKGGYWYDKEIEFCDDGVDGFEEDVSGWRGDGERAGVVARQVAEATSETVKPLVTTLFALSVSKALP